MTTYRLDLVTRTPLSLNHRQHWAARSRAVRLLSDEVIILARKAKIPHCDAIHVVLHYRPAVERRRDQDNLVATSKVCLDGLRRAKVIRDDTPAYVTQEFPVIEPVENGKLAALWLVVTDKSKDRIA